MARVTIVELAQQMIQDELQQLHGGRSSTYRRHLRVGSGAARAPRSIALYDTSDDPIYGTYGEPEGGL
jgi:hypothetical protein